MKRHFFRKKDVRGLKESVRAALPERAAGWLEGRVEMLETDLFTLILVDGERAFVLVDGSPIPFLGRLLSDDLGMKRVAVDRGAIPFVTKGADVMRPGIVRSDPAIGTGELVLVVDDAHGRPLAVGRALHPGGELAGGQGKGVVVIHYVGDEAWTFSDG